MATPTNKVEMIVKHLSKGIREVEEFKQLDKYALTLTKYVEDTRSYASILLETDFPEESWVQVEIVGLEPNKVHKAILTSSSKSPKTISSTQLEKLKEKDPTGIELALAFSDWLTVDTKEVVKLFIAIVQEDAEFGYKFSAPEEMIKLYDHVKLLVKEKIPESLNHLFN